MAVPTRLRDDAVPELGSAADPTALVPGDPAVLHEAAWSLGVTADVLREAADGLARLSTPDGWSGVAADRFRSSFTVQPARWDEAARAHRRAADALEQHAVTLERAQRHAADAIELWAAGGPTGARAPEAVALLTDARSSVQRSGDDAAAAVESARDRAPDARTVPSAADLAARTGNAAASLGTAALHHPLEALGVLGGGALAAVSAAGALGSIALDATGVGAVVGVPLGGASAAGMAVGAGLAGAGTIGLALNAAGPDRVTPFRVDADAEPVPEPPPFPPPTEITGMTKHGQERAEGRNGGAGVSDEAMADAVANPVEPPAYQPNGVYRYRGRNAEVCLNENGEVVTTWPKSRQGHRNQ